MKNCWSHKPEDRLSFKEIRAEFLKLQGSSEGEYVGSLTSDPHLYEKSPKEFQD